MRDPIRNTSPNKPKPSIPEPSIPEINLGPLFYGESAIPNPTMGKKQNPYMGEASKVSINSSSTNPPEAITIACPRCHTEYCIRYNPEPQKFQCQQQTCQAKFYVVMIGQHIHIASTPQEVMLIQQKNTSAENQSSNPIESLNTINLEEATAGLEETGDPIQNVSDIHHPSSTSPFKNAPNINTAATANSSKMPKPFAPEQITHLAQRAQTSGLSNSNPKQPPPSNNQPISPQSSRINKAIPNPQNPLVTAKNIKAMTPYNDPPQTNLGHINATSVNQISIQPAQKPQTVPPPARPNKLGNQKQSSPNTTENRNIVVPNGGSSKTGSPTIMKTTANDIRVPANKQPQAPIPPRPSKLRSQQAQSPNATASTRNGVVPCNDSPKPNSSVGATTLHTIRVEPTKQSQVPNKHMQVPVPPARPNNQNKSDPNDTSVNQRSIMPYNPSNIPNAEPVEEPESYDLSEFSTSIPNAEPESFDLSEFPTSIPNAEPVSDNLSDSPSMPKSDGEETAEIAESVMQVSYGVEYMPDVQNTEINEDSILEIPSYLQTTNSQPVGINSLILLPDELTNSSKPPRHANTIKPSVATNNGKPAKPAPTNKPQTPSSSKPQPANTISSPDQDSKKPGAIKLVQPQTKPAPTNKPQTPSSSKPQPANTISSPEQDSKKPGAIKLVQPQKNIVGPVSDTGNLPLLEVPNFPYEVADVSYLKMPNLPSNEDPLTFTQTIPDDLIEKTIELETIGNTTENTPQTFPRNNIAPSIPQNNTPKLDQTLSPNISSGLKFSSETFEPDNLDKIVEKLTESEALCVIRHSIRLGLITIADANIILNNYYEQDHPRKYNVVYLMLKLNLITKIQFPPIYNEMAKNRRNNRLPQINIAVRQEVEQYLDLDERKKSICILCPNCKTQFVAKVNIKLSNKFRCGNCNHVFYMRN